MKLVFSSFLSSFSGVCETGNMKAKQHSVTAMMKVEDPQTEAQMQ